MLNTKKSYLIAAVSGWTCFAVAVIMLLDQHAPAQFARGAGGPPPCVADITDDGTTNMPDGVVDTFDLLLLLGQWGPCASCPPGTADCGSGCIDILFDDNNCGGCNLVCPPGFECQNGTCVSVCPPGLTDCGGFCVNTNTDTSNCGACGNQCPPGFDCVSGSCTLVCPPGTADCSGTGVCQDIDTDPNNCGGCGVVCPPGFSCVNGTCVSN